MLCISQLTLIVRAFIYPLNFAHVFFPLVCFYIIMDYSKSRVCILCLELSVITTDKPWLFWTSIIQIIQLSRLFSLAPNCSWILLLVVLLKTQKMLVVDGITEWYSPWVVNATKTNDGLCNAIKRQVFEANKHAWTF